MTSKPCHLWQGYFICFYEHKRDSVFTLYTPHAASMIKRVGIKLITLLIGSDIMSTRITPNSLSNESSPYLLQHAHNPVAWMPWGEAAFEKARKEDKPIFLSIGYSTCHWCHVLK